MSKVPALYRLSRFLGRVSTVALVVIILYLATAAYSASQLRPGDLTPSNSTTTILPNGTVELAHSVNLTNPGFYPINSLSLAARVHLPSGPLLAAWASPSISVGPASTVSIPILVDFPSTFTSAEVALLTHDEQLPSYFWVNVTYASVLTAALALGFNISWGAPFYGLNVTVGTPVANPNGTVTTPVTVSFQNHAQFGAQGTVAFSILSASGAGCGSGRAPVQDAPGAQVDQTIQVVGQSGCDPRGGTLNGEFTGSPWAFSFPTEPIP